MLHAVVMAGGSGTRFWPMSRRNRPKHLLPLVGSESLLEQTVGRLRGLVPRERTWVITGADHAGAVRRQLDLPSESVVAEPSGRDTGACIGLAAALIERLDAQGTMVVTPADHVIEPLADFHRVIERAVRLVEQDDRRLVTIGIVPDRAATGYGYIERGAVVEDGSGPGAFRAARFREKPPLELAEQLVRSGECYWNSGIFVWNAAAIRAELERHAAALAAALRRIADAWTRPDRAEVFAAEYERIEKKSIDYAVLEKSDSVVVVEARFQWDDVGSWGAIARLEGNDEFGNSVSGNHCGLDTKSCIVIGDAQELVATLGVRNLIIVRCGNATLVADRTREESVKELVERIRQLGYGEFL